MKNVNFLNKELKKRYNKNQEKTMYELNFLPFVGKSYNNKNMFGNTKIMVLGESHYGTVPSASITRDVLNSYLDPSMEREGWMNTFVKFERSLVDKETSREDSKIIWDSLLFYNYVQVLMTGPREAATMQQYRDSEEAFFQVMEEYQPDVLIVWGKRLWSKLPYTDWEDGEEIRVDNYPVDNGYYTLKNGHKVRVFCVYHPSAGYDWSWWHKVISIFIHGEDATTNVIDKVGFSNFKRFSYFPEIHLGGVNIIVGPNNAGKSTFDKAAILFLDFIQKWLTGSSRSIHFDSDLCQKKLGINSYEDAFNYNADKDNERLCFNMTIGRYYFEAAFAPDKIDEKINGENRNSATKDSKNNHSVANVIYVKLVDTKDNNCEYVFHYNQSQDATDVEVTLPNFWPTTDSIEIIEAYLKDKSCPIEPDVKESIYSNIYVIRDCFKKIEALDVIHNFSESEDNLDVIRDCFKNSNILDAFKQIDEALGGNTPNNYDLFECLRSAIEQVVEDSEEIQFEIPRQKRTVTPKVIFEKLRGVNELQPNFDESRKHNPRIIEIKLCPIITLTQKKTFSIYDTDSVSVAVSSFCQKWKDYCKKMNGGPEKDDSGKDDYIYLISEDKKDTVKDDLTEFLKRWLEKFAIGTNFRIHNLSNEVFIMEIWTMDGHWAPLTNLGMGSVHMVTLLLNIANLCIGNGRMTRQVLIIEEPEINLHPNWQSMLAELLMDIYDKFGIQIIVETHSEYLVRKTQVLVANQDNHPFKVYYFPSAKEKNPYCMKYQENGLFAKDFDKGFFDEAGKLHIKLLQKQKISHV